MTLGALFDEAVARFGERPVLLEPDVSYVDYAAQVNGCAHVLRSRGVGRGDAVAAVLPNSPLLLTLWLALAKLGAVFVPLNPALRDAELEPLLAHADVALVVTDRPLPRRTIRPEELDVTAPAAPDVRVDPDDPVCLLYTSGTTGAPKGCVLSHTSYTAPAPAFVLRLGLDQDDRLLACLPLFHMAGQSFAVSALRAGASIGVVPKFSASGFWDQVARFDATVFRHLGEMLTLILRSPAEPADHRLRLVYGGGARPEVALAFTERFGTTVVEGYGMSETNTVLCGDPFDPRPGSMGTPLPPAEVRVDAPAGEVGEIQVRGPGLMKGYHRDPGRTTAAFASSWLRTGDLGWMDDDAHVHFAARRTDVIRRCGENVDPGEIEEALAEHPDVLLGAVVGVPGEMSDEDVAAFVVPLPGARLAAADVRTWCRTRLAAFKVPSHVHVVDRLPMTPTSKINRSLLRAAGAHGRDPAMVNDLAEKARTLRRHVVHLAADSPGAHVGGSMSVVEILTTLYFDGVLRVDPADPDRPGRDRLIFSKGHSSAAYYAALAEAGFFPVSELDTYKKTGSRLAGHPHTGVPGVELATGSLGHGLPVGVGLAMAARADGQPGRVFVIVGDGECQEGSVWEAAMAAAHYQLDNLVVIVDRNGIQEDGPTEEIMALEPFADKWRAFGWATVEVDGHDVGELSNVLHEVPLTWSRPTAIIAKTVKGKGLSFSENTNTWHYGHLSADLKQQALQELGGES